MCRGFIKLERELFESQLWKEARRYSHFEACLDLLHRANFRTSFVTFKNKKFTIEPGEVFTSLSALAERWQWDRRTVRKYVKWLEETGALTITYGACPLILRISESFANMLQEHSLPSLNDPTPQPPSQEASFTACTLPKYSEESQEINSSEDQEYSEQSSESDTEICGVPQKKRTNTRQYRPSASFKDGLPSNMKKWDEMRLKALNALLPQFPDDYPREEFNRFMADAISRGDVLGEGSFVHRMKAKFDRILEERRQTETRSAA